jgi:hypothetical protein
MAGGAINTANYTIGGAKLYFCSTVADERLNTSLISINASIQTNTYSYGNIVTSDITPEVTYVEHWTSSNGKRVKDKISANTSMVSISFTFDEMNQFNLGKFFMGTSTASSVQVLQDTLDEGCAALVIKTDIGQDLTYFIPKCVIRPDGALDLNAEDWHSAPMIVEVLEYQTGDSAAANATANASINTAWIAAPFGRVDTANL